MTDPPGVLYVVGTPIGNLGDLSPRAARILSSVDAVICEDSRRTGRLLAHVRQNLVDDDQAESGGSTGDGAEETVSSDRAELLVANEHTEVARTAEVLERLEGGHRLALVSDAGMPTISDPGSRLVRAVADAGHRIEVVPGPTALSAGLALSGLDTSRFVFEGFLPRKGGGRSQRLADLAGETRTVVLYEAPHRLRATLGDLLTSFGPDRVVAIARELTKLHEEVVRGPLGTVVEQLEAIEPRGEYVIVLAGRPSRATPPSDEELVAALSLELAAGSSRRDAVSTVVAGTGVSKRRVYDLANSLSAPSPETTG